MASLRLFSGSQDKFLVLRRGTTDNHYMINHTNNDDALQAWRDSAALVTYSANYREVIRDARRSTLAPGPMPGDRPTDRPAAPPR